MDAKFTAPDGAFKAGIDKAAADAMAGKSEAVALRPTMALGHGGGDIDIARDFKLPPLKIAYGVGAFAGVYPLGSLVLGRPEEAELLAEPLEDIVVVLISYFKYWKEWLKKHQQDAGEFSKTWNTEAEARKAGFITEYSPDRSIPAAAAAMDIKLLIEAPTTGLSAKFWVTLGGKSYAPAYWSIDKMVYKACGDTILKADRGPLSARGLHSGRWTLHTAVVKKGSNTYVNPVLRLTDYNSDSFIADVAKQLGHISAAPADEEAGSVGEDAAG